MNKPRYDMITAKEAAKITNQILDDDNLVNEILKDIGDRISKSAQEGRSQIEFPPPPKESIYIEVCDTLKVKGYSVNKTTPVADCEVWVIGWGKK